VKVLKSYQFIKKINATEVGQMGTNETYILVPSSTNVDEIFPEPNQIYKFKHKSTGKLYDIRLTVGREQRIVGLGIFYRENDAKAGSKIMLERRIYPNNISEHFIDIITKEDSIVLQASSSNGFRILNEMENSILIPGNPYKTYYKSEYHPVYLEYSKTVKPRQNSPRAYDYYNLVIGTEMVNTNYANGAIIEIIFRDDVCEIIEDISYQKIDIERV